MMISPQTWLSLAGSLVLFLGPGYGLMSFCPARARYDRTQVMTLAWALSIAMWAIGLAWLHALRLRLLPSSVLVIGCAGWAVGLVRLRPSIRHIGLGGQSDRSRIALWGVVLLSAIAGSWALRDSVVGPGSDSYHHTLITQMIVDRGMLPDDYQPYAPLVTFTYHFGFHGLAAAISWLTGVAPAVVVPVLAQFLAAASALSVAFLAQAITGRRSAAAAGALITGLVSVFPAYFINWGRYTQLAGLVLLPIFLGLVVEWVRDKREWSLVPYLGVLAAGIALTHYRVALMTISGVVVLLGADALMHKVRWRELKGVAARLTVAALITCGLIAPWLAYLLSVRQQGYAIDTGTVGGGFFALERLGPYVLSYPTNAAVIGMTVAALLVGWWLRERAVIAMSLWAAAMLFLSTPRFAGVFMDTISVVLSLFIPAGVLIGCLSVMLMRFKPVRWIVVLGMTGLGVWGGFTISSIVEPGAAYVASDDMPAIEWIRANVPASARFMVNTFHWDYLPQYVIGSDAGYWLPLLAGRMTVTAPMVYASERSNVPDFVERLSALDRLNGRLTSSEALDLLRREGITHVYIGQRGGKIDASELQKSEFFRLEYTNGSVFIFSFINEQPSSPGDSFQANRE